MFNFIKIDGKFKQNFNGFIGKMQNTSSPQTPQTPQTEVLRDFLSSLPQRPPLNRADLFNPIVAGNTAFSQLFGSGILSSKKDRDALFKIMSANGASVSGGNVTFSHEFSSQIDSIVLQFLQGINSQSSSDVPQPPPTKPKATVATAGGSAVCQRKTSGQPKAAVATAGGGAVCHKQPSSSKPSKCELLTFAQFQESKHNGQKPHLTCVVCEHTMQDGSGTCKHEKCGKAHPFNLSSIKVMKSKTKTGKTVPVATVCPHFNSGGCKLESGCTYAHLSQEEYAKVVEKNRLWREQRAGSAEVSSSTDKPKKPSMIVPSQVRFERPSQASHPVEIPDDEFISGALLNIAARLQPFAFDGFDVAGELSRFMSGENASAAVSPSPRSYSPAVEILDSDSDVEQGDE